MDIINNIKQKYYIDANITSLIIYFCIATLIWYIFHQYVTKFENKLITNNNIKAKILQSFISSVIWGLTYLFIRRKMNPDTYKKFWEFSDDALFATLAFYVRSLFSDDVYKLIALKFI